MNYQEELDNLIEKNKSERIKPSLLLHCCCGPCASYCIDYLHEFFDVTALFYNPNIMPMEEFNLRLETFKSLLTHYLDVEQKKIIVDDEFDVYLKRVEGLENVPEGGARCDKCIELRLEKTASLSEGFDYFATTLTVSPHKNAVKINELGRKLEEKFNFAEYLPTDFKKKDGFLKSIQLSKKYNLYRQTYCGCKFD